MVRAAFSLWRCRHLRRPGGCLDGGRAPDSGPAATLHLACPGSIADRPDAAVHPDRRTHPLVTGLCPNPRLRREPLRPSHAHRPGTTTRNRRLMAFPINERLPVPMGTDPQSVRTRVEAMERLLERLFVIPGTKQAVGLDAILDLVPVIGDIADAALGDYIVWEAKNLGMSKWQMARMTGNVGINWLLGLLSVVPVVGVIPTLFFRSNSRNLKIIKRHLEKHHASTAVVEGQVTSRQ